MKVFINLFCRYWTNHPDKTTAMYKMEICNYRIDPKFSDRQACANSVDTDETAPNVCNSCASSLIKPHCSNVRIIQQLFGVSKFL